MLCRLCFFRPFLFQYHDQVVKIDPRLYSEMPNAKTQYLRATAELVSIFLQFLISNFLFFGGGGWGKLEARDRRREGVGSIKKIAEWEGFILKIRKARTIKL